MYIYTYVDVDVYIYMYIYMYLFMCVHIYIYTHTHIRTFFWFFGASEGGTSCCNARPMVSAPGNLDESGKPAARGAGAARVHSRALWAAFKGFRAIILPTFVVQVLSK